MKRVSTIIALIVAMIFCCVTLAAAEDVMMTKTVKSITFKKSKNGNQYARIMIGDKATLNGVSYNKDTSAMVFDSELLAHAKTIKKGSTIKFIADKGTYRGSVSYTILKFL